MPKLLILMTLTLGISLSGCGGGGSSPASNKAPTANAGADQSADEGTTVNLSATGADGDGTIVSFSWQQESGTAVSITNANMANASFVAPMVAASEVLLFRVTVTDNDGATGSDTVTVTVNDIAPPPPPPPPPLSVGPEICIGGNAGDFSCSGVSLSKRVSLETMGGTTGNDIWGWFDASTGNEYALMGMTNGTAFVDITNPEDPVFLGRLPSETVDSPWRDIKVYQNHAYIVADNAGAHGMQVFDLTRLWGLVAPQTFSADFVYGDFENAHNLAINEDSGFAYAVGTNDCGGGLHIIDISTPINPMFAGCHFVNPATHDSQCVIYQGPDADHLNREICVSSNGSHVEVVDVTDKSAPVTISSTTYPQLGFVHQGWLTEDHRFFLMGDETDEFSFNVPTRIHVFDLSDLDAPVYVFAYEAATAAIDHNLYVLGNRVFQASYTSGLRVLEFVDLANSELMEIAFFDTFPTSDATDFSGAWSVYPYLPSGTIIVSDITNGLFILSLQ
jgi:choice-of-anchor B domain-containing protein